MWYLALAIGWLLIGLPAGAAAQAIPDADVRACIVQNQAVMGTTAEVYCARLRDEARARQEAAASASRIERTYQDCLILNQRTMGSLAESYCTERRNEALALQAAGGGPPTRIP